VETSSDEDEEYVAAYDQEVSAETGTSFTGVPFSPSKTQLEEGIMTQPNSEDEEEDSTEEEEEDLNRVVPPTWEFGVKLEFDDLALWSHEMEQMVHVCLPPTYESEVGTRLTALKFKRLQLWRNLFSVLCCLAYEDTTVEDSMGAVEVAKSCGTYFWNIFHHFHQDDYGNKWCWKYLPKQPSIPSPALSGEHWPPEFRAFIHDKAEGPKAKTAIAKLRKKAPYSKLAPQDLTLYFMGEKVRTRAVQIKGLITAFYAKRFLPADRIPSGRTREQMFRAIRKLQWPHEARRKAETAARARNYRGGKGAKSNMSREDNDALIDSTTIDCFRRLNYSWYSDEWLAFVFYSLPAAVDKHCLRILDGGKAKYSLRPGELGDEGEGEVRGIISVAPLSPTGKIRKVVEATKGRAGRRRDNIMNSNSSARGGGTDIGAAVAVLPDPLFAQMTALKGKIPLMEELGMPAEDIRLAKVDLLGVYNAMYVRSLALTGDANSSSSSYQM
jgi:hypothetical protein